MKLPKDLSGRKVVDALVRKLEYRVVHEKGSHIVLVAQTFGQGSDCCNAVGSRAEKCAETLTASCA
jgi:hypothetical protein